MDESQVKHLATVLSCVKDVTIDWAEVARLRGIARKDNAMTSFKGMIKKAGIEYANNKFTLTDTPDAPGDPAKAAKKSDTPKKAATPRKRKSQVPTEGDDKDDKAEPASPTKRRRAKKPVALAKDDIKAENEEAEEEQAEEEL